MRIGRTLNIYLARVYGGHLLLMLGVLLGIVYLFDTVELLRRGSKYDDVTLGLLLRMGLLKLPEAGQVVLPFAVLFSALFTFWQLNRRHELVVVRAAGFSVWQFMAPVLAVGIFFGLLQMTVINPAGALLLGQFERMESAYLARKTSNVALFREGLWLRQNQEGGTVILHANRVDPQSWRLQGVTAFYFSADDDFGQRLDAPAARLEAGRWLFRDVTINEAAGPARHAAEIALPTDLTGREIEESFAAPQTLSFWAMPGFIRTMEATGFDAVRLRVHYHSLLAQPLLFAAMILLAATVALRPPRAGGTGRLVALGVTVGFVVFLAASFLQALGASHQIPALLAAWAPALVTALLGVAVMLGLEDG